MGNNNQALASLVFLAVISGCSNLSPHDTDSLPLELPAINPPFEISRQCFSGIFDDYKAWSTKAIANGVPPDSFTRRFPENEYTKYKNDLVCYFFEYPVEGLTIEGFLIRPRNLTREKLPVVISNRGGNAGYGAMNTGRLFHSALPLADEGFVVIGSNYRGGGLNGQQNKENGFDEFGGRDVNDVIALFDIIDQLPFADPTRIGMLGWSRGGFMTFLAATKTDRLSAIAVGGAPSDLLAELEHRPRMESVYKARIPDYERNKIESLRQRSPPFLAEDLAPDLPVLILHGQADKAVSVGSAMTLTTRLNELGRNLRLVVYENDGHAIWNHRLEIHEELLNWFAAKLGEDE